MKKTHVLDAANKSYELACEKAFAEIVVPAVKESEEFKTLQKYAPDISEIAWAQCDSGFNDGEPSYMVTCALFDPDHYQDDEDEEDDENSSGPSSNMSVYRSSFGEYGDWDNETASDKALAAIFLTLSHKDKMIFADAYSDVANKLQNIVGHEYRHQGDVRIPII